MHSRPDRTSARASERIRASICNTAARLISEDGINDYSQAKRKALRHLGLPDDTPLPSNAEIDEALQSWQNVFQEHEQTERIGNLRRIAIDLMANFEQYTPYLTGSVLSGTAGRYAEIDLQLFADSAKEVEIFLLNKGIPYTHATPRNDRAEAVLQIEAGEATANLVIYPPHEERNFAKSRSNRNSRTHDRARIDAVRALLTENTGEFTQNPI
ncbi:MAG: hypothetical protein H6943_05845 [Zoogloeaceae bacterium]|nr:hypothetical protein [Zoogloeaceae bacterium]